jgi:Flp pilus assembly protein TadG
MMTSRARGFGRSERGAAMVEFAIVLPLLVMFVGGIVDLGRAYKLYNNLAAAVRDGARYGASLQPPVPAQIITRVNQVFASSAGASRPAPNATVTLNNQQVVVTVAGYAYDPLTPFVPTQALNFNVSATFRREDVP